MENMKSKNLRMGMMFVCKMSYDSWLKASSYKLQASSIKHQASSIKLVACSL